ncbi:Ig-like domain-containing protein, partial [Pluralibacter gergoviae]|uniref:Ig-like domain-containing protein n=1 Tax=Pluralibacter gergoviae TaxID=61647 RepID=UPI0005EC1B14
DTAAPGAVTDLTVTNDATGAAVAGGGSLNDNTPTVSGRAEPGSTVTVYDGANELGHAVAGEDGSWRITLPTLEDGTYDNLTAVATDAAGNSSAPVTLPGFTVDTAAPGAVTDLTVTNDATGAAVAGGGSLNDNTPTVSGRAEPGSTVTVYDGATELGHTTAGEDGSWRIILPTLEDGTYSGLTAVATDAAGNTGEAVVLPGFTIDTVVPVITDVVVTNDRTSAEVAVGGSLNDNTPTVSGRAEPGSTVTVYDGA